MIATHLGLVLLLTVVNEPVELCFAWQSANCSWTKVTALSPPLRAAMVSPISTPEWVKGYEVLGEDGEPSGRERLAKVRFTVLDSYPATTFREMTCYAPVDRQWARSNRLKPDSQTFKPLPNGRYVLVYADHAPDGKLHVPECFHSGGTYREMQAEADAVCGGSLVPTDATRLAAGKDLPAVLLRSYVQALKSKSGRTVRAALASLIRIYPPVGPRKALAGLAPGQALSINGVPAERFYLDDLVPSVQEVANGSKPARKLAMYGLLSAWGIELDGEAALDALLELAKTKEWDGFDPSSDETRFILTSTKIGTGDGEKWLEAVEAMPPGPWQLFALRQFGPSSIKEKDWPRLLRVALGDDDASTSISLGWLRIFSGNQSELVRLSEQEQLQYWRTRLGVNP